MKKEGIILEPTKLKFENEAVLNPACIKKGNNVHMFYRAVRKGNYSSIGYCRLDGPLEVVERSKKPILSPEFDYEKHGIEDPRIVRIGREYYLTYIAYDGINATGAYATSRDLKTFDKKGIIVPLINFAEALRLMGKLSKRYAARFKIYNKTETDTPETVYIWGKDIALFPKRIKGRFALLHRVLPDIPVIFFKDFKDLTYQFWKNHMSMLPKRIVVNARYSFESRQVGAGCPPIETKKGWLLIYHAVEKSPKGNIYRAAAALADKNDPTKIIGRLDKPLFSPEAEWERRGDVSNVVFPSGSAIFDDRLYIYYGAADKRIAVASLNLDELLGELLEKRNK